MLLLFAQIAGWLRTSSGAPDHVRTIPTVGTGQFASTPASFPPTPREPATLRSRKQNNLARNGTEPMAQTQLSALEKPATDKAASPKSKYVAPHSLLVKTLNR